MFYFSFNFYSLISLFWLFFSILSLYLSGLIMFTNCSFEFLFILLDINSVKFTFSFMVDKYSLFFTFIILLISSSVFFFCNSYMMGEVNSYRFIVLLSLFVISMLMLVYSGNVLSLVLGWDGLGLVSFLLVIFYNNKGSLSGGILTFLTNRFGDSVMILSLSLIFMNLSYSLDFTLLEESMVGIFFMVSAITKSAQFPFSAWLPSAMAAPTPVSSLVHSSTLVTAGVFLLFRLSHLFLVHGYSLILFYLSMLTMLLASSSALFEMDFKKIIALSTLSQLSVMMMVLSLGHTEVCYFHMVTHAMFKALMFLSAGSLMHGMFGSQDIRFKGGLAKFNPIISMSMLISLFSLSGLPFLSGYYSKDLIIELVFMMDYSLFLFFFLTLGFSLTLFYSLRMFLQGFFNYGSLSIVFCFIENPKVVFSLVGLMLGSVFGGSLINWFFLPCLVSINLSVGVKISIFMIFFFSFFIFYFLNKVFYIKSGGVFVVSLVAKFFGSMWFLPFSSSQVFLNYPYLFGHYLFKVLDQGWLDYYSVTNFYFIVYKFNSAMNKPNFYLMFLYFPIFLLLFFTLI
uniref:NADH-ubiquinone oxidoreductase chain 5 n=1 Tax=Endeis sp. JZ-2022 TaxID=2992007 RepID=A0A9E7V7C1_9CHEL|nr:NADH dehydrogenase subunit 5 [Endeis sp. JZ-2022]